MEKERNRVFWKVLASECGFPPPFSVVWREIDVTERGKGERGGGSGDQSPMMQTTVISSRTGPPPSHPLNPTVARAQKGVTQKGVMRAVGRGEPTSAAAVRYWPLSHELLISSGFQTPGTSSTLSRCCSPCSWREPQEIACRAAQAYELLGTGPSTVGVGEERGAPTWGTGRYRAARCRLWAPVPRRL